MLTRCIAILMFMSASSNALASGETLTFRLDALGRVEAVISGLTGFCNQPPFHSADSIVITGTIISINSILGGSGGGCPVGTPQGVPYQVVATLGHLALQTYTVVWTTSFDATGTRTVFLSSSLVVGALNPVQDIPTMSAWTVAILLVLLLTAGAYLTRQRRSWVRGG
jgi:hypothetical protein